MDGQPLAGRVADLVGNRRAVTWALVGLIVTSFAAALAPSFVWLVVARLAQACCAAALGPVIGGVLTQAFGWEAIFLVNVPIAAGALFAAVRTAPRPVGRG